jgi:hypothetical protein
VSEQRLEGAAPGEPDLGEDRTPPATVPSATLGTGSALAIGCVVAVIVLLVVALALRWLTGVW